MVIAGEKNSKLLGSLGSGFVSLFLFLFSIPVFAQNRVNSVPSFSIPDTVCVNTPVSINNTSTDATSYYWNFCVANINTPPVGVNLNNPGGALTTPVYIDYVFENGNYYGFSTNNWPGKLLR